jgi:hypothetical protein
MIERGEKVGEDAEEDYSEFEEDGSGSDGERKRWGRRVVAESMKITSKMEATIARLCSLLRTSLVDEERTTIRKSTINKSAI